MIVAGLGCRKGVSAAEVIAAVEAALRAHGLAVGALSALATTTFKRDEAAIFAAGRELGLPVVVVEDGNSAIAGDSSETLTTPSPSRGGIEGGGMKSASLPDLTQDEGWFGGDRRGSTPTPNPSPQGGGGRQRRTSSICNCPPLKGEGGIDAAPYDQCDSRAPGRKNEGISTLTHSARSQAMAGTPSVSETSALAAAGEGARLCGPRIVVGPVTCALATSGDAA